MGVISLAGVFISIILYITLIPAEIERRTIYSILSKPVQRYQYLTGKFLGGLMTVLANIALMGVIFLAILTAKLVQYHQPVAPAVAGLLVKNLLMVFLQMTLLGAVAMFFLGLPAARRQLLRDLRRLAARHQRGAELRWAAWLPASAPAGAELRQLRHPEPVHQPQRPCDPGTGLLTLTVAYALIYTIILLMVGTVIFDRREV